MRQRIIELYKSVKDLEVKRNLLHLLNNKYLSLGLYSDADWQTETLLDKFMKARYGRNFNTAIFEL